MNQAPPTPDNARLITAVALVVVAIAWSIAGWRAAAVHDQHRGTAERQVLASARAHAAAANLSLAVADQTLLHLRQTAIEQGQEAFERAARLVSREDTSGPINRAALIDANGMMRANFLRGNAVQRVNVADRPYFAFQRITQADRLFVNEPIQGRISKQWIVLFSRPLLVADEFQGIVFAGFETSRLTRLVDNTDDNRVMLTLLSPEGRIAARSLDSDAYTGKQFPLPDLPADTPFVLESPIDGKRRISAASRVTDWGMTVVAGIEEAEVAAAIHRDILIEVIPATLLSLLLLPAAWIIRRAEKRRLRAEQRRAIERERSRLVLETMREGVLLLDAHGLITYANAAGRHFLNTQEGHQISQAISTAGFELATEEGEPFAGDHAIERFCLDGGHEINEVWLTDPSRAEQWLMVHVRPFREQGDAVSGAVVTITDRSDEHERLTESALTNNIIAGMDDALMITDARGRILRINAAFARLTGYGTRQVIGQTPSLLRSGRHPDAFYEAMWSALLADGRWSGQIWNRHRDGSEYCVWHTITSVHDRQGRIVRYIAVSRDVTMQEQRENELWRQANFDALTGLANRSRFDDHLRQTLTLARRHQHRCALCYLDLDRFKPVNDTLGHAAGDALLRQVALRIGALLRREDLLARIGGDEFALILPEIRDDTDASRVADKIVAAVSEPFPLAEGTVTIGISIGIACFPDHGLTPNELGNAADTALYAAKSGGRGTWRQAEPRDPHPEDDPT